MKLIDNVARPVVQPIRMYFEMIGKRKIQIIGCDPFSYLVPFSCHKLFCSTRLFLFSCRSGRWRGPALESISYGCSSVGCLAVHFLVLDKLLSIYCILALFNAVIKYPLMRKSVPLTVAGCIIVVQMLWQFVMHVGSTASQCSIIYWF